MSTHSATFQQVVTVAQTLIQSGRGSSEVTPGLIVEKVGLAMTVLGLPGTWDERDGVVAELIRRFSHWIGRDSSLRDEKDHEPWLRAERKRDWRYWHRLQSLLEARLSLDVVFALDRSTDEILGLLEDPHRKGAWDRRGLVVGHVQSGKTSSYSALICKAADAGYKIIIVLAGLHNNLRSQTQVRLEEAFLGYETSANRDPGRLFGVGEIDSDPQIHPHCATTRADKGDFSTAVAKHFAVSPEARPWLFVVKKNKTVLTRLLKWIQGHVADAPSATTGRRIVTTLPLLVIDDEADHASVDTGEQLFNADGSPDEEHQPRTINSLIRKILHSFAKKAYVGYTATPFANIFIHRRAATIEEGPDLFPQSFIINLAAPSNYIGPARVFGQRAPEGRTGALPLVRTFADHCTEDGKSGWMPPKHNKEHRPACAGGEGLPESLETAILAFVLACTVRDLRGQAASHSSMLIHVTRFTNVQREVTRQVEGFVTRLRQRLWRGVDDGAAIGRLREMWLNDFVPSSQAVRSALEEQMPLPGWDEVEERAREVVADISVRMINGTARDALDYTENEGKGLKVIAIGGEKLSRGLTLEGLCCSYFVRTTKMYDTLMQMGRWFGYRPGYLDICRLYTTKELVDWFGHITDASEELRDEFDAMVDSGATPADYGLRVQSHSVLLVTSPLKMRTARSLQLSFSGDLLETVALHHEATQLDRNLSFTDRLVAAMGEPAVRAVIRRERGPGAHEWCGHLWDRVGSDLICDFFEGFVTHPGSRKVNSKLLAEFIAGMAKAGELNEWTVACIGGGKGRDHTFSTGLQLQGMVYRAAERTAMDRYSIGRLLSPRDEAIDLEGPAWSAALELTRQSWKEDPGRSKDREPPELPNGPAIRRIRGFGADGVPAARERGLLLLYLVDPEGAELSVLKERTAPIVGFGVSFPSSNAGVKVEYKVDHLLWEREYGEAD